MALLTVPYVTPAEFIAHPTYLDVQNLRSGSIDPVEQTGALREILLKASAKADTFIGAPTVGFGAHVEVENVRMRANRDGRLVLAAASSPVIRVVSLAYGASIGALTTYDTPTVWIENHGRTVIADMGVGSSTWSGSLQFGSPTSASEMFTTWTYEAGYPNSTLTADVDAGASTLHLSDATGLLPGGVLRLTEPGAEETITVADDYTIGSTTVGLASALLYDHTSGAGASAIPADVKTGVIYYACAALQRPGVRDGAGSGHKGAALKTSTAANRASKEVDFVCMAEEILASYRRVR